MELGIDSIKLVQTIGIIEQHYNITLEVEEFYDMTVNNFLKIVENKKKTNLNFNKKIMLKKKYI